MKNCLCTLIISALIATNKFIDATVAERIYTFLGFLLPVLLMICQFEVWDDKRVERREFEEKLKKISRAKCK